MAESPAEENKTVFLLIGETLHPLQQHPLDAERLHVAHIKS